jgi:hypothetical protein
VVAFRRMALGIDGHGLFYFAEGASETVLRDKNVSLYLCAAEGRKFMQERS